jgi:transcriptional regulator with XRE-family HTH domain
MLTQPRVRRRGRNPTGRPHPIDLHVGRRMRQRRTLLGLSQERLAESLGLTFQQVQKYERGANRVSASRLYELGRVLEVPIGYFFEDLPVDMPRKVRDHMQGAIALEGAAQRADPLTRRETLELVRAYYRIREPKVRRRLFEMARALAAGEDALVVAPDAAVEAPRRLRSVREA